MKIVKTNKVINQLRTRQAAIAKERDKLRDLYNEISMLMDSCDRATEALEDAIEALSELV